MTFATAIDASISSSLSKEQTDVRTSRPSLPSSQYEPSTYGYTTSTIPLNADEAPAKERNDTSAVVSEVAGVILSVQDDFVRVRLSGKAIVNFPKALFSDLSFVRLGQQIRYQIKKTYEGTRYQNFVPEEPKQLSPEQNKILELLDQIEV